MIEGTSYDLSDEKTTGMPHKLPSKPEISPAQAAQLTRDFEHFSLQLPESSFETHLLDEYGIDVSSEYAGIPIKSPFGKASGQLSMTARQVRDDVQAGLGFVVLKTVIAENESGSQSMSEWAIEEAKMVVEPIRGKSGETGWTVSWKGRGWSKSFQDYLQLIREAQYLTRQSSTSGSQPPTLIVPSCKYHLPASEAEDWKTDEYQYTTKQIWNAWQEVGPDHAMPLEKDFSPTLAGSSHSQVRQQILHWLQTVPQLIRDSFPAEPSRLKVGLKIFNTLFGDDFQLELLKSIHQQHQPDFFIYGNRLFDPHREFDGKTGIAYGGPDLSDRNLRILDRYLEQQAALGQGSDSKLLPLSATGNIHSGRMAMEYALRGAENFQMHTFFQLPASEYACRVGNKTHKALQHLYFHPQEGMIAWMLHLADQLGLDRNPIRFRDLVKIIRSSGPA